MKRRIALTAIGAGIAASALPTLNAATFAFGEHDQQRVSESRKTGQASSARTGSGRIRRWPRYGPDRCCGSMGGVQ